MQGHGHYWAAHTLQSRATLYRAAIMCLGRHSVAIERYFGHGACCKGADRRWALTRGFHPFAFRGHTHSVRARAYGTGALAEAEPTVLVLSMEQYYTVYIKG